MRKTSSEIEKMMLALGCGIRSSQSLALLDCDPEKQILKSLKFYWEDNSVFFLIYTSLLKKLYPYIHVDRLIKLAKNSIISNDEKCLLIAVCDNLSAKDHRFKAVRQKLFEKKMTLDSPPKKETSEFLKTEWGEEASLKKFGTSVRSFYIEKDAKLNPLPTTFKTNKWLKIRALLGSNSRADATYIIFNSKDLVSPSEVSRLIFSTRQSVGKYYKDLHLLKDKLNTNI